MRNGEGPLVPILKGLLFLIIGVSLIPPVSAQTLQSLAEKNQARVWWDSSRQVALLANDSKWLTLDPRTKLALGNGSDEIDLGEVTNDEKGLRFDPATYQRLLDWFNTSPKSAIPSSGESDHPGVKVRPPGDGSPDVQRRIQVIVIDPGHGGTDPGSMAKHTFDGKEVTLQEKNLTLTVALTLEKLLKDAYPDRTIVMTRRDDSYPTLEERVKIAHGQKLKGRESIIFLSIHFNASLNKNAKGLEFWYVPLNYERDVVSGHDVPETVLPVVNAMVDSEFKKESQEIATSIADALGKELGEENTQRGLKENPWFVVRMTKMPAVLVELGFITNDEEGKKLTDPEYLKKLSQGLYNGLQSFIRSYEGNP